MKCLYSVPLMRQYETTQNTQALGSDRLSTNFFSIGFFEPQSPQSEERT